MKILRISTLLILLMLIGKPFVWGQGTVIDNGSPTNKWILHNPEDNRKTLFIAPWTGTTWDWGAQTQFQSNGNVLFSGNVGIGNPFPPLKLSVNGEIYSKGHMYLYAYEGEFNSGTAYLQARNLALPVANSPTDIDLQLRSQNQGQVVEGLRLKANGNVGIGTTTPSSRLHVSGGGFTLGSTIPATNTDGYFSLGSTTISSTPTAQDWGGKTTLLLNAQDYTTIGFHDSGNRVDFIRSGNGTIQLGYDGGFGPAHIGMPNGVWNSSGSVGIGTTNPGAYKLAVEGKIGAREVEVKTGSWADFVFRPDYRLRPLCEVASYIATHSHLPEIPSEAEVKANGIGLGEMNAKLLQKIEELTLYMIEQQNQLTNLQEEIKQLKVNK